MGFTVSVLNRDKSVRIMTAIAMELPRILARVPVEALAAATGRCKRSALRWISGESQPSAADLIAAIQNFDEIAIEIDQLAGRKRATDSQVKAVIAALKTIRGDDDTSGTNP
jgi:hypothetical protein